MSNKNITINGKEYKIHCTYTNMEESIQADLKS